MSTQRRTFRSIAGGLRVRLSAVVTTTAMVAAGLGVSVLTAPSAAAAVPTVADTTATTATADALPTVQIDGVAWDQEVVGNTVWVGGQFGNARPAGAAAGTQLTARANLLAYNLTTGALITTIAPSLNNQAKVITKSPDGSRVYVGGQFTTANGANRYRIAAYNASTGALITTFAPVINATVSAIVATDTTVYVGGIFNTAGGQTRNRLAAFAASNGALTAWAPSADASVNAMVLSPDGAIIVGGFFQNINGSPAYGLAKVNLTNGDKLPWDPSWGPHTVRDAGANSAILSLSTDGTAIYGSGYHFGDGGNLEGTFSADPASGALNWVTNCHGDTYDAAAVGGVVYTVSHAHYCTPVGGFFQSDPWSINMRFALAFTTDARGENGPDEWGYYNWQGTPSPAMVNWYPKADQGTYTGKSQAGWTIEGSADGKYVVMGGEFPRVNGVAQQGLVRFAIPSVAPKKVGPDAKGSANNPTILGLPSGKTRVSWKANWDMDNHTLTYRLTRDNVQIYQTTGSNSFWDRPTMGFIDSGLNPGTLYKYRLSVTDPDGNVVQSDIVNFTAQAGGGSTAYANRVIADGAAPYWPLNETTGTVFYDNAGFTDADTTTGLIRGAAGAITGDSATTFNNASSATRTAVAGPDTYTVQAWINTTTTSGGKIIGFGGSSTGDSGSYDRHIYMDNAGRIWYGVYPNGVATLNSTASYNDGQWHQITATLGPDGMKLFIDAKLISQRGDVTWGQVYTGYWRVGGDNLNGWPNQPSSNRFAGAIDEVAIYPTVLSRQKIDAQRVASGRPTTIPAAPADAYGAAVFNDNPLLYWRLGEAGGATTAVDSGPNGDQTGIYQNGVTLGATGGVKGTSNTAASFDGNNDFVASTNSFNNPKNFSEEAWFKTTTTNGGKIIGLGSEQNGTSGGYDRHVYMSNDGKVTFGVWTGFTNTITTPNALNDGVWHHVVATQSTTDGLKLYIDGALVGTNGQTDAQDYNGYWRVGGDNHWGCCSPFVNATIDDAAVYGYVLTGAQAANHYNLGNTVVPPNQAPVANFTSSPSNLTAAFTNTSNDPDGSIAASEWNFGDSTPVSTDTNPTHTYAAAGTYTVSLKVTDNRGETAVVTHPVTVAAPVNNPPGAAFMVSSQSALTINLDGSASTDGDGTVAGYSWNYGDSQTGSGATSSHTYAAAGTYTVTLTVTDDDGATGSTSQTVTVDAPANQAPIASFSASPVQLTVTVDGSASSDPDGSVAGYAWTFGDGGTATGATPPAHTYAAAGRYTITLTVTDNKGAVNSSSNSVEVTSPPSNQGPSVGFHITSSEGLTVNVESTSTDPDGSIVDWAWEFGDGSTASTASANHTYTTAGTYSIKLTVTDNNGAQANQSQSVTVEAPPPTNQAPTAAFTSTSSGLTASFNGSGSSDPDGSIAAYSWTFGDTTTDMTTVPTTSHVYAAAGTYSVTLQVTDNQGATKSVTNPVTVSTPAATPLVNDTFTRTVANAFGTANAGGAWTIAGGNTNFSVNGTEGKIRLATAGSGPSATLGAVSTPNVDESVNISVDKAPTGAGVYLSLAARKVGNSEYRTTAKLLPTGQVQLQLVKIVNGTPITPALRTVTVAGLTYTAGDTITIRLQVTGTSSVNLNAKVWKTGTTEPAAWQATATDAANTLDTAGGLALYPYLSGSSTNSPVVVTFDNLTVYGVTP